MSGRRVRHREHNSSLPATRPYVFLADEHYCTKLNDRLVYVDEQRDEPRAPEGEDADVFAEMVRVMQRVGPAGLTLGLRKPGWVTI
jgi:hypothetical protein